MNSLLIVDFDSTFICDETLDEIANLLLSSNKISKNTQEKITNITNQAMDGKLDFKEALQARIKLLNIHKNDIDQIILILNERVSSSFIKNKKYIQEIGESIYIVSGGFKEIIAPIVKDYGIPNKNIFANEFKYDDDNYINGINEQNLLSHSDGKIRAVKTLNLSNGGYVIGDGSTDLDLQALKGIKAFICFIENINRKAVSKKAKYVASSFQEAIKIIKEIEHND